MPLSRILLLFRSSVAESSRVFVQFLVELAVDGADFWIGDAIAFTFRVEDWVDVETGCGGLAGEETDLLDKFLLEICGEVVLCAEEDNAALRDWFECQPWVQGQI